MNKYRKSAEEIMKRGDKIIAEKKRKAIIIKRNIYIISGLCAAVAVSFGIWNNKDIQNAGNDILNPSENIISEETTTVSSTTKKSDITTTITTQITVKTTQTTTNIPTEITTTISKTKPIKTTFTTIITQNTTSEMTSFTTEISTSSTTKEESPVIPIENPDAYCICKIKNFIGNNYSSYEKVIIEQEKIGELIDSATVELGYYNGYKGYNEQITTNAEIYSVNDFSEKFVVAVKYSNENNYYIYENKNYFPDTLDNLINDCGFEKYLKVNSAEYYQDNDIIYCNVESGMIWDMLSDEREITAHRYINFFPDEYISKISLVCEMPEIYDAPVIIGISEKGIITVNLCGNGIAFDIGEEKTNCFIDYCRNEVNPMEK